MNHVKLIELGYSTCWLEMVNGLELNVPGPGTQNKFGIRPVIAFIRLRNSYGSG